LPGLPTDSLGASVGDSNTLTLTINFKGGIEAKGMAADWEKPPCGQTDKTWMDRGGISRS